MAKPALLKKPQWAIQVHSSEGEIIGEPFCGTGTTIVASELTGRICYAMELDPKWCAVTLQRWVDMTEGEPILIN